MWNGRNTEHGDPLGTVVQFGASTVTIAINWPGSREAAASCTGDLPCSEYSALSVRGRYTSIRNGTGTKHSRLLAERTCMCPSTSGSTWKTIWNKTRRGNTRLEAHSRWEVCFPCKRIPTVFALTWNVEFLLKRGLYGEALTCTWCLRKRKCISRCLAFPCYVGKRRLTLLALAWSSFAPTCSVCRYIPRVLALGWPSCHGSLPLLGIMYYFFVFFTYENVCQGCLPLPAV